MSGTLSHSPADIVRYLLVQLGQGTLPSSNDAWPVFVSSEPNLPDQAVTVYDTAGHYDGRNMRGGEKYEFHGVQIRVRGVNHQDAFQKANGLAVALDVSVNRSKVPIGVNRYMVYDVSRTSGPLNLGNEENTNRIIFTINAVVSLRQST